MPSRFQPVELFTLEALVARQQWSILQPSRRQPVRRAIPGDASRLLIKESEPAGASFLTAVEPGENK